MPGHPVRFGLRMSGGFSAMVRWLIGSSIKSRRVVLALAVVVVAFGVWHLRDLKADALPEFGPPTVQIQTEAPGLAPAEVEGLVTLGMEHDLLNGIPWLAAIRSRRSEEHTSELQSRFDLVCRL